MRRLFFDRLRCLPVCMVTVTCGVGLMPSRSEAGMVSFQVDPTTIDGNSDGFITGNEFSPVGDDGVVFTMEPTNNLVGGDRFLLSATTGLRFGGGGGSTLSFDFSVDQDIKLDSYTLAIDFAFLGDSVFDIRQDTDVLSAANTAVMSGDTHNFNSGPVPIDAGVTYTFITEAGGAAVQSFLASWQYTAIPEPGSLSLVLLTGLGLGGVARGGRTR